jgi:hypothetical protein
MPDIALLDIVMPHSVAADLGVTERELWQMVRRREFCGPALINLGGKHRFAVFLKADIAAWEAGNQLPRTRSAQAGHGGGRLM